MRVFRIAMLLCGVALRAQVAPVPPRPSSEPPQQPRMRPPDPPKGEGSIEGTVVDRLTGAPVRKAIVNLSGGMGVHKQSATDASGRFVFEQLPEGIFNLTAMRSLMTFPSGAEEPVELGKGARKTGVTVKLTPPAVVTGRVVDEDGEPMMAVQVMLLRADVSRGKQQWMPMNGGSTDDRGEYRIHSIPPGRYRIAATANLRPGMIMAARRESGGGAVVDMAMETYAVTYYPNTRDLGMATTMRVAPGSETRADFRMQKAPMNSIRGRVVGAPNGPAGVNLQALARDLAGPMGMSPTHTNWNEDGTFTLTGFAPGRYWVVAHNMTRPGETALSAMTAVDTRNGPVEGIQVVLTSGIEIAGRLKIEGDVAPPMQGQAPQPYRVFLMPGMMGRGGAHVPPAEVDGQGRFRLVGVPQGVWDLRVEPMPRGGYLKSMKLGDQDVLRTEMEIGTSVSGDLEIVLSTKSGLIEGTIARAKEGLPIQVMALPEGDERLMPGFQLFGRVTREGRYQIEGVRPGKYRVFASAASGTMAGWRDPDVLKALESKMTLVTVEESGRITQDLTLISAQDVAKAMEEAN